MNAWSKAGLIVFFLALCAVATVATRPLRRAAPAPDARVLYAVVNSQLAAFRAHDFGHAYLLAASGVQEKFSVDEFKGMIFREFAEMTTEEGVEFGRAEMRGTNAVVEVFIEHRSGAVLGYSYLLAAEENGWRIEGVEPLARHPQRQGTAGLRL